MARTAKEVHEVKRKITLEVFENTVIQFKKMAKKADMSQAELFTQLVNHGFVKVVEDGKRLCETLYHLQVAINTVDTKDFAGTSFQEEVNGCMKSLYDELGVADDSKPKTLRKEMRKNGNL